MVELAESRREILYGVSMFAYRPEDDLSELLARFPDAPCYLEVTPARLRTVGYPVYATGSNPDHYDVQLVPGVAEEQPEVPLAQLTIAARGLVECAGEPRSNPSYAGPRPEEES